MHLWLATIDFERVRTVFFCCRGLCCDALILASVPSENAYVLATRQTVDSVQSKKFIFLVAVCLTHTDWIIADLPSNDALLFATINLLFCSREN